MNEPFVIETTGLRKNYDGVEALRGLDLQVPAGSIYGFLGRNGAGKTTAMKILLGMQDLHPVDLEFRSLCPEAGMAQHIAVGRQAAQFAFIDKGKLTFIERIRAIAETETDNRRSQKRKAPFDNHSHVYPLNSGLR